ncbi:MAG: sulfur oxidation c-type cytochrome SoxX [Betaproteobacteria bacterium]
MNNIPVAKFVIAGMAALALTSAGAQSAKPSPADIVMKASFKDRGQAKVDRLEQDETQRLCSQYPEKRPMDVARKIEALNMKLVKYPADGKLLGDWKEGEKVAQSGVGKQFSDNPANPSGGNCYACHQLTKAEISFGNIGPSLYNFGKLRGFTEAMQRYAYGKIYNADAYSACTNMPRFGHQGILTEQQIKNVTALLMDPNSPVNK